MLGTVIVINLDLLALELDLHDDTLLVVCTPSASGGEILGVISSVG